MKKLALSIDGGNGPIEIKGVEGMPTGGLDIIINIIQAFIYLFFIFAIIFALFVIIYSGWLWLTSVGDKQKIAALKQRIVYALVGLIVVLLSFFIINFVTKFFGFNLLNSIPSI